MALKDITDSRLISLIDSLSKFSLFFMASALISLESGFWLGEWLVSFLPQIIILQFSIYMALFSLYMRFFIRDNLTYIKKHISKSDRIIIALSIFTFLYVTISSVQPTIPIVAAQNNDVSIASFNAQVDSEGLESGVNYLQSRQPDIAVVQEVLDDDKGEISSSLGHEYVASSDCKCSVGDSDIVVTSNTPITSQNIYESPLGIAMLIDVPEHDISLVAVHLSSPINSSYFNQRNSTIELIGEYLKSLEIANRKFIVIGDFNTSVFSKALDPIKQASALVTDSGWPNCTWYGYGEVLCTAIDHIFVSRNLMVSNFGYGLIEESDHRPIYASIIAE